MRRSSEEIQRFAAVVQRDDDDDIELDVAALLIGAWEHQSFDVEPHRRALDRIAASAAGAAGGDAGGSAGVRAVVATLFSDLGFRGNTADYYDPRNSFLAEVLERRVGIPITLSVLTIEVARRIGVRAVGVGFPGHFLVRVDDGPTSLLLDPFNGGAELDRPALESLLARTAGPDARLTEASLAACSKRATLIRMLNNLAGIYERSGDRFRSLEVLERLVALDAENPRLAAALDRLRRQVRSLN
jgi:regulator of sirC expression with transglutaminase-like and TPR domain